MARLSLSLLVLIFIIIMSSFVTTSHGRKLLTNIHKDSKLLFERLYMAALPKGNVPASTPTKKGHSVTIDQKLIARHLRSIDRILKSVPSPGGGH